MLCLMKFSTLGGCSISCGIVWYGALPGLGEGECCVTNVGGILPIATFTVLGELSAIAVAFIIFPNKLASSISGTICLSPMFGKGVAGGGCFKAWIGLFATIVAFSTEDLYIMLQL